MPTTADPQAAPDDRHVPAAVAELVADFRARGIQLFVEGTRLKVVGDRNAYTSALRAQLLGHKADVVAYLQSEASRAGGQLESATRAWASSYVHDVALAWGYSEELAQVAAELIAKSDVGGTPFRVGHRMIALSVGGCRVRVHREPAHLVDATRSPHRQSGA